jgi:hypothetical protein
MVTGENLLWRKGVATWLSLLFWMYDYTCSLSSRFRIGRVDEYQGIRLRVAVDTDILQYHGCKVLYQARREKCFVACGSPGREWRLTRP